jgi:hypothetical protein
MRKLTLEHNGLCIINATLEHTGYQGGDAGHGGYVAMTFQDSGSASMECYVNDDTSRVEPVEKIEIVFRGDDERDGLIKTLKAFVKELEENPTC